jgi:hypothetical protein
VKISLNPETALLEAAHFAKDRGALDYKHDIQSTLCRLSVLGAWTLVHEIDKRKALKNVCYFPIIFPC